MRKSPIFRITEQSTHYQHLPVQQPWTQKYTSVQHVTKVPVDLSTSWLLNLHWRIQSNNHGSNTLSSALNPWLNHRMTKTSCSCWKTGEYTCFDQNTSRSWSSECTGYSLGRLNSDCLQSALTMALQNGLAFQHWTMDLGLSSARTVGVACSLQEDYQPKALCLQQSHP